MMQFHIPALCGKEYNGGTEQCAESVHEAPGQNPFGAGIPSGEEAARGLGMPSDGRVPAHTERKGETDVPGEGLPGGGKRLGHAFFAGDREPADFEPDISLAAYGDGFSYLWQADRGHIGAEQRKRCKIRIGRRFQIPLPEGGCPGAGGEPDAVLGKE